MFENIGGKIKTSAKVLCTLNIISSIAFSIAMFVLADSYWRISEYFITVGVSTLILGPITAVISSYLIYGFGELVENSAKASSQKDVGHSVNTVDNDLPEL